MGLLREAGIDIFKTGGYWLDGDDSAIRPIDISPEQRAAAERQYLANILGSKAIGETVEITPDEEV